MEKKDLAIRSQENPLLTPKDLKPVIPGMEIACLLNPGVFRYKDKIGLVVRVAERPMQKEGEVSTVVIQNGVFEKFTFRIDDPDLDVSDARVIKYKNQHYLTTLSYLRILFSNDGLHFYEEEEYPPVFGQGDLESFGIEDCRVSKIANEYYLTYSAVSPVAVGVGMMKTNDWKNLTRYGMIFPPHNKDCAFFEEKINGKYYALHRPSSPEIGGNYIWIAESTDLIHWGNHQCLLTTRPGMWDEGRIGAGCSPIKTPHGWLAIYHGASYDNCYCLGAILMDLHNPSKVLARTQHPIMRPITPYEQTGFFGNVVFSNGQYTEGDTLHLYYGASDEVICYARFSITEIMSQLV
ncbi:glycoside hydrolase family 130 protein, partial [Parabacteroides sp. OttesenSCG-928-K15]|nr:glycoside hydrolase family 130 protein [Parabacteroides sp. OttesenSCG-928-K15]